ncbi:MAG: hypothetical protein AAB431_01245 [Patescibacteria group bacterium]
MRSPLALIAESAKTYKTDFPTFIGYSAWLLFPFAVFVLLDFLPDSPIVNVLEVILIIAELCLYVWIALILMLFAKARIKNEAIDSTLLPQKAKQLIQPVLLIAVLQFLMLVGGFILLIVPFFIFAVWFGLAQFTTVFENKRGLESLSASRALSKGRFWKTANRIIVGPLLLMVGYYILLALVISLLTAIQGVDPIELLAGEVPLWINVVEAIGQLFYVPIHVIYLTHVYLELTSTHATAPLEESCDIA